MKDRARREHEAAAIMMAAVAGEATEADLSRLNEWIREDRALADLVVDVMSQESWLSWQGGQTVDATVAPRPVQSNARSARSQFAIAAALLIALGAAAGSVATKWRLQSAPGDVFAIGSGAPRAEGERYVARFVQGTACLWNSETGSPFGVDEALRTGESLNLLEGLAEVQFDWSGGAANIKLEGPAGLVLTAQRGANLSRGRLTADVQVKDGQLKDGRSINGQQNNGAFMVETPNGQIEVTRDASIGVAVRGEDVELHVFRGAAMFVTPWPSAAEPNDRLSVSAGESLTVASDADGRTRLEHGLSHEDDFASKISMGSDNLPITQAYVDEILDGKPLLYWRFEGDDATTVRNEVGDRYEGRVVGAVKWVDQGGNKDVEMGAGLTNEALHAYVVSAEPLAADFREGYSIEMWIKPSHYHWGTVASLIGEPPQPGKQSVHGMLFELGGPITYPSSIEQPGKYRFLHRSPPSDDLGRGTSCFSNLPYELRKWQHVAAVKDGDQMRLYVDGRLVATGVDSSELPSGLRLIVGQLDEVRDERRFIGQLDELAVYPRALSDEEIHRRYELIRNQPAHTPSARRSSPTI